MDYKNHGCVICVKAAAVEFRSHNATWLTKEERGAKEKCNKIGSFHGDSFRNLCGIQTRRFGGCIPLYHERLMTL
jgi:hypothetical protein